MFDTFEGNTEGCYLYSRHSSPSNLYLGEALAAMEGTETANVYASGMGAISSVIMQLCDAGDHIVSSRTIYGGTYAFLKNFVKKFAIDTSFIDITDIEVVEKSISSRTKMIYCEAVSNPLLEVADIKALAELAKKHNILLVNDNPYSLIQNTKPESIHSYNTDYDDVLELNSLSKSHNMAGWRIGMLGGASQYIQNILRFKSNMDSGMFYGIQKGAVTALKSGAAWFKKLDEVYSKRRNLMYKLVDEIGASYDTDTAGMFVWAKLPKGSKSSEEFINELLYEKNIFIAPGTIFGSNGEGYIRFSLCVTEDKIKEAIKRLV